MNLGTVKWVKWDKTVELLQLSSTMSDGSGSADIFFAVDVVCETDDSVYWWII